MSSTATKAIAALALGAALTAAACNRAHLTASYGRANHEAFARQVANPEAATKPNPTAAHMAQGLDSQEAAIVSKTYRRNLAPRSEEATGGNMLYYAPRSAQAAHTDLPPPSVPDQR